MEEAAAWHACNLSGINAATPEYGQYLAYLRTRRKKGVGRKNFARNGHAAKKSLNIVGNALINKRRFSLFSATTTRAESATWAAWRAGLHRGGRGVISAEPSSRNISPSEHRICLPFRARLWTAHRHGGVRRRAALLRRATRREGRPRLTRQRRRRRSSGLLLMGIMISPYGGREEDHYQKPLPFQRRAALTRVPRLRGGRVCRICGAGWRRGASLYARLRRSNLSLFFLFALASRLLAPNICFGLPARTCCFAWHISSFRSKHGIVSRRFFRARSDGFA